MFTLWKFFFLNPNFLSTRFFRLVLAGLILKSIYCTSFPIALGDQSLLSKPNMNNSYVLLILRWCGIGNYKYFSIQD